MATLADQSRDHCHKPAGSRADFQHTMPRPQIEQNVAGLGVRGRQSLARSVHVDHHGVAVDIDQLPYGIGVVVPQRTFVAAVVQRPATQPKAVDEHVPGRGGHRVAEPFRQAVRHAVAPKGGVQHVEEPGHVLCDFFRGWRHDALLCCAVRAARRDADATKIFSPLSASMVPRRITSGRIDGRHVTAV
jgi:hypothetical protein